MYILQESNESKQSDNEDIFKVFICVLQCCKMMKTKCASQGRSQT